MGSGLTPPRAARGEESAARLRRAMLLLSVTDFRFRSTQTSIFQGLGFIFFWLAVAGANFLTVAGHLDCQSRWHFGEIGRSAPQATASGPWPGFAVGGARTAGETRGLRKRGPRAMDGGCPWGKGSWGGGGMNDESIDALTFQKSQKQRPWRPEIYN